MVMQRGAKTAIWGKSTKVGDRVNLQLDGKSVAQATVGVDHVWETTFTPPDDQNPHAISASSSLGKVTINDVLFGDVWICSGQSNMEYNTWGVGVTFIVRMVRGSLGPYLNRLTTYK